MDFFTTSDFDLIIKNANRPYDKNNAIDRNILSQLKNSVVIKTEYWASEVVKHLSDFTFEYRKNSQLRGRFIPYTWAKIYRKTDKDKYIFFTVGIDPLKKSLVYKLDYQFNKASAFNDVQQQICKKLIKKSDAAWATVSLEDINNYNWKKLVSETVNFISKYLSLYDFTIQQVWGNEKRIARLSWNDKGWVEPSGRVGKSPDINSYEYINGFGHEEWLFDFSKLIDGYHYSFLEPVNKEWEAYIGKKYDIELFSINGISKKRYYIGRIKNAEVINRKISKMVLNEYARNGWIAEMQSQLEDAGGMPNKLLTNTSLFNIRFSPRDVEYADYIELPPNHPIYNQSRYVFQKTSDDLISSELKNVQYKFSGNSDTQPNDIDFDNLNNIKTNSYDKKPKSIEITFLHENIQNNMLVYLRSIYGKRMVRKEHPVGNKRVDIVVKNGNEDIFYEIKAYTNPLSSVREAIGQLFEYSYFPDRKNATKLIIVTPNSAENQINDVKKYIYHLRTALQIPIYLQIFDLETKEISEEF